MLSCANVHSGSLRQSWADAMDSRLAYWRISCSMSLYSPERLTFNFLYFHSVLPDFNMGVQDWFMFEYKSLVQKNYWSYNTLKILMLACWLMVTCPYTEFQPFLLFVAHLYPFSESYYNVASFWVFWESFPVRGAHFLKMVIILPFLYQLLKCCSFSFLS